MHAGDKIVKISFYLSSSALVQHLKSFAILLQAKKLETDIYVIKSEMENPSEVELELKRRLRQMTDHLIQKQAQVQ